MRQSRRADDVKNSAKADTQSSVPQVHYLEECSKAKVVENCPYTFPLTRERLKLFFAQLFLSIRNELQGHHNKIVWLKFVLMQNSWHRLMSDRFSWQKTLKNSHNLQNQWLAWVHFAKRWQINWPERLDSRVQQNWEVTTSCQQGKYGVEIRIESINKDNSHSWVRISHGLNKLVTDLNNNEQDDNEPKTSETQFEDYALKSNVLAFASRSKDKAKPRRSTSACSSTKILPISEIKWTDAEPEDYSPVAYPVSQQLSTLLRHGHLLRRRRWSDWILDIERLSSEPFCEFSTLVWCNVEEHNDKRRRKQEKISILHWYVRTRNSLSPSSFFKVTQDAISVIFYNSLII